MDEELNSGDALLSQRDNKENKAFYAILCVVCIILLAYNLFIYFIRFVPIIGESMENTIFDGQYCMVQQHLFSVDYGDIVIIDTGVPDPEIVGENRNIVKRLIAKDGDRVLFMRTEDGNNVDLYICKRGENTFTLMQEPYIKEQMLPDDQIRNEFSWISVVPYDSKVLGYDISEIKRTTMDASRIVPDGEVFVLGDNRNNSKDSRSKDYGTFPYDKIVSKVLLILDNR